MLTPIIRRSIIRFYTKIYLINKIVSFSFLT